MYLCMYILCGSCVEVRCHTHTRKVPKIYDGVHSERELFVYKPIK